jgi:UDP-N-acetylmuramoyl-tripeptide--D-alanyl-D-alanine ligase
VSDRPGSDSDSQQLSMAPLWTWAELCTACGLGTAPGPAIHGICIDSRQVIKGDLFIALAGDPGPRFSTSGEVGRDGHEFIGSAVAAGASGLMVVPARLTEAQDVPQLQVADTLDGLWQLGRYGRARMSGQVVGITGSSGKTTARQWLQGLLGVQAATHASVGSFNNHWGVPLSLARMPADSRYGLFEIGMNHPGEIAPLASLVNMDVALVLNVLPAHLGSFASIEGIRQEKLSICRGLKSGGTLVVPDDLDLEGAKAAKILRFGLGARADVRGVPAYFPDHTLVDVYVGARHWQYQLNAGGEHRVLTSLASFAVMLALGADLTLAAAGMADLGMPRGRGDETLIHDVSLVDDSYNANPVSMRYALEALGRSGEQRQKVAILGEMLELGAASGTLHQQLQAACGPIDGVITVGEGFRVWDQAQLGNRFWGHYASADDIDLAVLDSRLAPGAMVLVKGSNRVFWAKGFVSRLKQQLGRRLPATTRH